MLLAGLPGMPILRCGVDNKCRLVRQAGAFPTLRVIPEKLTASYRDASGAPKPTSIQTMRAISLAKLGFSAGP